MRRSYYLLVLLLLPLSSCTSSEPAPQQVPPVPYDELLASLPAPWNTPRIQPQVVPVVSEPVRLHVAARRFLCAASSDYQGILSPASIRSLKLQGGPLTAGAEVRAFAEHSRFGRDRPYRRSRHKRSSAHNEPLPEGTLKRPPFLFTGMPAAALG